MSVAGSIGSPRREAGGSLHHRLEQRRVEPAVDEDALDRAADLAVAGGEATLHQRLGGGGDIRVLADDGGVVAAELQMHLLQCAGRHLEDAPAGSGAAGHGDHLHAFGGDQRLAGVPPAGHHLMRAARQPRLLEVAADLDHGERTVLRRLGDDCVPGGKPAGDLVAPELDRVVERHDGGDHAERLPHGDRQRPLAPGDGVEREGAAEDALGLLGIAAEDPCRDTDLARRLADPLAVLAAEQHAELFLVRLDPPRHRLEDLEAPVRRQSGHPCGSVLRRGDGAGDVGLGGAGNGGDLLAGGGVEHRIDGTVGSARPASVDQHVHRHFPAARSGIP